MINKGAFSTCRPCFDYLKSPASYITQETQICPISLDKKNSIREEPTFHSDIKLEISKSSIFVKKRSVSELFSEKIFTFCPEINNKSHRLHSNRPSENIHQRLYTEKKAFKRCKSLKVTDFSRKTSEKIIINDNIYKEALLHKAAKAKACILSRRSQLKIESNFLKPSPKIVKTPLTSHKRSIPIENILILSEVHKRSSRFRLVRKFQST